MSGDLVTLKMDGDVAVVTLNDPATLNALSYAMGEQFQNVLDTVEKQARAMLLTGAGRGFCSGANLNGGFPSVKPEPADIDCGVGLETSINPMVSRLRDLSLPWISAVRGVAAGGGAPLALSADLVVASENARFVLAFARIGLVPDAGSFHILVRTIGRVRANELMLLGGELSATEAKTVGLVNRVVPDDDLDAEALALANRLAQAPASTRAVRRMTWAALDANWHDMLWTERVEQRAAGRTDDFSEGVAAFREKRPARFTGA